MASDHPGTPAGFGLLVQSPVADVPALEVAIDKFTEDFAGVVSALSSEEFERHRAAILTGLREKPKSLAEQSARYWGSIDLRDYDFARRQQVIAAIEEMTLPQVVEIYGLIMREAGYSLQLDSRSGNFMGGDGFAGEKDIYRLPSNNL